MKPAVFNLATTLGRFDPDTHIDNLTQYPKTAIHIGLSYIGRYITIHDTSCCARRPMSKTNQ